ncbi:MAG: TraR/DksA C4-type zinc finger protein [Longimicrobiales bacterium]|nr:TraR/DksA C4-type zinc finger protein [Longimicrobiales bacterium]
MSPPLTAEQIAELRDEIDRILARLERSMAVSDKATATVELDQTAVGRLSRMDSLQNQSMANNLAERERARHAQLRAARARIDAGSFGVCEACGGAIEAGRLFVFPETTECLRCE